MSADAVQTIPAERPAEPIFVFGTDLAGRHESESARLAVTVHDAGAGTGSGATGNAYAIPCRSSSGEALPRNVIKNYSDTFLHYAAGRPEHLFHVARFGCEAGACSDAEMAGLFASAPVNCRIPGVWRQQLEATMAARLIVFDPSAYLRETAWLQRFERYLALNVPLWGGLGVEIVSVGGARNLVANDAAAKKLGLKHHVIGVNEAYYGRYAAIAAEARAVWYATHMLSIFDFEQTAQPNQVRMMAAASRNGLLLDQMDTGGED